MGIFDDAKHEFFLNNGKIIKSLPELSFALKTADDSVFERHVNSDRNDFANWIKHSFDDNLLRNKIANVKNRKQMIDAIDERLFELSMAETKAEELPLDMPPDTPPDIPPDISKETIDDETFKQNKDITSNPNSVLNDARSFSESVVEEKKGDVPLSLQDTKIEPVRLDAVIEIREISSKKLGYKPIDRLFKNGIPSIGNIIFAGKMSTGKTETAMKIALQSSKAAYISLQDTEEKIINTFYVLDNKVLEKINAGSISIKKLDTFEMARTQDIEPFTHLKGFSPDIVIVDSLSSLRLSFGDNQIGYRYFIDKLFKYFESLGIIAVFIKELDDEKEINKEFYENILSDIIITFAKNGRKLSVVKYYKSK